MHSDPDTSCPPVKILSDEELPSIAVVIPCWNAERWVARSIQSVLDQDYPRLEVIVIDDGSTDDSLQIIKSISGPIQWKSGPNQGACAARNRGLQIARAEYVIFLDADDYLESGSLDAWARCALESNADIAFGAFAFERDGQRAPGKPPLLPVTAKGILRQWLVEGWFTPPCAVLWRRSFVAAIGAWNVDAIRNQDGELTMRALLHTSRIAVVDSGLGVYVLHDSPNRVSKRVGYSAIVSELASFTSLWKTAQARGHQDLKPSFAHVFYCVAVRAYSTGIRDVGDDALCMARQLGLWGHIGSATHRTLSYMLGLRVKVLLSDVIKGRTELKVGMRRLLIE